LMNLDLHWQRRTDWQALSRYPLCPTFSIITPDAKLTFGVRSFDDMGPVDEDERWAPFEDMHKYLRNTFPLMCVDFRC
jgi:hypothetical protein